ncbi:ATP-binding cassette domain-containing protein [Corynebacterium poyangense]|uniref:ATP-binding cassette domain-containing protein n=1 Tax=Corynebacterium poyangense TaxID=2684405 RepID=A0A7H0SPS1_9CORY|nr:ABC-F family ATP-binding cassette domain-containing protein [Corynebacterium poyangense]QNQ90546.1 ATP-binding cassette domain-containing protein [Corynebacterium poyangense]
MPSPLHINIDGVSFSYPTHRVLTDISFSVSAGKVTGLIGENGAGKSTLLKIISGTLTPDAGVIYTPPITGFIAQEISLPPEAPAADVIEEAVAELRAIESRIEDLSGKLDNPAAAEAFDRALAQAEESGLWDLDARIATVLSGLGLAEVSLHTPLREMSGGQRRRFALASLVLRPTDALVLDEPTNHLDDAGVDFLIGELNAYSGPVLVASHDRYFLDQVAQSLVDLDPALSPEGGDGLPIHQGTSFSGSFSHYLKAREDARHRWQERYNSQKQEKERLESRARQQESDIFHHNTSKSETKSAKKFFADRAARTQAHRVKSALNRLDVLERQAVPPPPQPLRFQGIPDTPITAVGEPIVWTRGLGVDQRLEPLSMKVQPGEQLLILGPNGAGKSTLLSVIDGKLPPDRGEIRIPEDIRIGRLNQDDYWPNLAKTPLDIVGPIIIELGLLSEAQATMPLHDLSLGQRRRVSLAQLLAQPPDLLLLDEPTNHLSLALAEELEHALDSYQGTVVLATHDRWIRKRWLEHPRARILQLEPINASLRQP